MTVDSNDIFPALLLPGASAAPRIEGVDTEVDGLRSSDGPSRRLVVPVRLYSQSLRASGPGQDSSGQGLRDGSGQWCDTLPVPAGVVVFG